MNRGRNEEEHLQQPKDGGAGELHVVTGNEHQAVAVAGELLGKRAANAFRRTGDDDGGQGHARIRPEIDIVHS